MEEIQKPDNHVTSAAAFVEGGIQDACDDACSICLEEFSASDPSTVTNCRHDFHLQCILEWCQRSSQCPMCWQAISLKDPASQELLEAVVRERSFRVTPSRNSAIFHHPTLGDFALQHLPVGTNDPELEERIIQHLAAAAAMGRARHAGRRDGQRRPSAHGLPHFLVFSPHPSAQHSGSVSSSMTQVGGESEQAAVAMGSSTAPISSGGDELSRQTSPFSSGESTSPSRPTVSPVNRRGFSLSHRSTSSNSSLPNQEREGPSEFQSFSENIKSRLNAASLRYKESFSRSTRSWKERWFSRTSSMSDLGNEVQREVSAGIASVSRMMERLEIRENSQAPVSNHLVQSSVAEQDNQHNTGRDSPLTIRPTPASRAASSLSN